jgi:hypothetical protein
MRNRVRRSLAALVYLWRFGPLGALLLIAATAFVLAGSTSAHGSLLALCGSLSPEAAVAILSQYVSASSPLWLAGDWLLMVLAMMPPLLSVPVTHIWRSNFETRRPSAMTAFALGYLTIWMAAGAPLICLALLWGLAAPGAPGVVALLLLALLWSASPVGQISRNRCHKLIPINPFGAGVARDSFRQGVLSAKWCVLSCWIWMVLPLATTAHHQATMAAVTLWLFFERLASPRPPRWGWPPMLAAAAQIVRS